MPDRDRRVVLARAPDTRLTYLLAGLAALSMSCRSQPAKPTVATPTLPAETVPVPEPPPQNFELSKLPLLLNGTLFAGPAGEPAWLAVGDAFWARLGDDGEKLTRCEVTSVAPEELDDEDCTRHHIATTSCELGEATGFVSRSKGAWSFGEVAEEDQKNARALKAAKTSKMYARARREADESMDETFEIVSFRGFEASGVTWIRVDVGFDDQVEGEYYHDTSAGYDGGYYIAFIRLSDARAEVVSETQGWAASSLVDIADLNGDGVPEVLEVDYELTGDVVTTQSLDGSSSGSAASECSPRG